MEGLPLPGRFANITHGFQTLPGMLGVVVSVVAGALGALVAVAVGAPQIVAVAAGVLRSFSPWLVSAWMAGGR
jgi:hypothetical protein